jgi:D-arginine dehydrogenase
MADIIIIGGGIAGASAAYELAASASVIVLEREATCGYHSTGRSAASFTENYGGVIIRRLAVASRGFLESPPGNFCDYPLLSPRGMITIAHAGQLEALREELERARALVPSITALDLESAIAHVPVLRREYLAGAIIEPHCMDLDVHGIHQGFLRGAKSRGASLITNAGVESIERIGEAWKVATAAGVFFARIIVNAAGAWADRIADLAAVPPLGLVPKRRTAFLIPAPPGEEVTAWPMVNDVGEEFYFKPDAGQLFVSPADASPSEPMDAYPDDLDVAVGVERLELATTIKVGRVARSWAGLRTFAADGDPVVGFDADVAGFFWLAAQGGYGIKTSPALSRACASLIREQRLPEDLLALGITAAELSPSRLRDLIPTELPS